MLVLLSFGLVLVATVLLVLGLLADTLPLIYLSILLSGVAAVVLVLAVRAGRPVGPAPSTAPIEPEREPEPEYAAAGSISKSTATMSAVEAPPRPAPVAAGAEAQGHGEPGPGGTPAEAVDDDDPAGEWLAADQEWGEPDADWEDDDLAFPIADYDDLNAAEILPLVPQLYPDEIDVVEARELAGRARADVLGALADARARLAPAVAPVLSAVPPPFEEEAAPEPTDGAPAPAVPSAAPVPETEPVPAPEPVAPVPAEAAAAAPGPEPVEAIPVAPEPAATGPTPATNEFEPIPETAEGGTDGLAVVDYDDMPVSDIVAALDGLDAEQLAQVRDYEAANRARRTIIFNVTRRLSTVGLPPATTPPAAAVAQPAAAAVPPAPSAAFPIDGYDALPVSDIVAALDGLGAEQLAQVRDYEAANRARRTIIFNVTRRLSALDSG